MPGLDYKPHSEHYGAKSTQKAILETGELGINNVSAFVLSASVCCLFSTIIMENIKQIADTPIISRFELGNSGKFDNMDDHIVSGIYDKGSKIRQAIEGAEASTNNRKIY